MTKFVLNGLLSMASSAVLACAPEAAMCLDAIRTLYADADLEGPALLDAGDSSERSFAIVRVVHPTHNNLGTNI